MWLLVTQQIDRGGLGTYFTGVEYGTHRPGCRVPEFHSSLADLYASVVKQQYFDLRADDRQCVIDHYQTIFVGFSLAVFNLGEDDIADIRVVDVDRFVVCLWQ